MKTKIPKLNNLSFTHPEIAKQWHPTKNGDLTPFDVTYGSSRIKIWWLCQECGYEWDATCNVRTNMGKPTGCPSCSGRRATHLNNITITHPEVVKEWHPTKNEGLCPTLLRRGSGKRVWWLCQTCNHEWKTSVLCRTKVDKTGCPACSGNVASPNNNFKISHPNVMDYWHPTKNGDLKPTDITAATHKIIWWLCKKCNYEWSKSPHELIQQRTRNKKRRKLKCQNCETNAITSLNNLAVTHPEIAKQWHPTKNGDLKPINVKSRSLKKVWWVCKNCKSDVYKCIRGYIEHCNKYCNKCNNITITHPEVVKEWHPNKNGDLKPINFTFGSSKKFWWLCQTCDHEWETAIYTRTTGSNCPSCNGSAGSKNYNLALIHPEVVKEWHPTKNEGLCPTKIKPKANRLVWWLCQTCDHEWEARICSRTQSNRSTGCPRCAYFKNKRMHKNRHKKTIERNLKLIQHQITNGVTNEKTN